MQDFNPKHLEEYYSNVVIYDRIFHIEHSV